MTKLFVCALLFFFVGDVGRSSFRNGFWCGFGMPRHSIFSLKVSSESMDCSA